MGIQIIKFHVAEKEIQDSIFVPIWLDLEEGVLLGIKTRKEKN